MLSWLVGGSQFKLLLNCIYTNDDDDDNRMVTQISRFR